MNRATPVTAPLTAGFINPVMQSQAAFRVIMSAMAEPGRWLPLPDELTAPAGLPLPTAVALLTLADFETPVWLPQALRDGAAGGWLRFHCHCPLVAEPAEAAFAVLKPNDPAMPRLGDFCAGDERFPDRSATVLVVCERREGGIAVDLSGPGIDSMTRVSPAGLGHEFWSDAIANAKRYPLGVDMILLDQSHIMGLPRSTRIEEAA